MTKILFMVLISVFLSSCATNSVKSSRTLHEALLSIKYDLLIAKYSDTKSCFIMSATPNVLNGCYCITYEPKKIPRMN